MADEGSRLFGCGIAFLRVRCVHVDGPDGAIYSSDYKSAPVMGLITTTARAPYFSATRIFTRETLPVGSVIVVDAGYNYRADGWYNATEYTTARPAKVSTPHRSGGRGLVG